MRIFMRLGAILQKLGMCSEVDVLRLLINRKLPMRASDLIVKETLFDTVPVRVYASKSSRAENRRGLVWIHGGGGLFGSLESYQRLCHFFAKESATVIVCIGYPLAPEHPYPAQQVSCYAAVLHFLKNAQDYGVDPERIVLGGDSSGGSIVAAISQQLVSRKDLPRVKAHVLLYPYVQTLDSNLPSYQQNHSVPLLFKRHAVTFFMLYLTGSDIGVDGVMANAHLSQEVRAKYQKWVSPDHIPQEFKVRGYVPFVPSLFSEDLFRLYERSFEPRLSPLLAEDAILRQFPKTFLLTCEYDIFRDDGLLYKRRLEENGVAVTWHHLEDGFHGISLMIGLGPMEFPGTRRNLQRVLQFLERF
ncbi:arylacetamide deacetylase-like 4 [Crotalus tigris]|uniref:arylacetamide deacetylase-like 4 n=1 Tax=Crotalus tigris TaxID=88082 RepID=UPI00192F5528|nr:arylacetamide deacetylase-like 4 [Crotalus tigris]